METPVGWWSRFDSGRLLDAVERETIPVEADPLTSTGGINRGPGRTPLFSASSPQQHTVPASFRVPGGLRTAADRIPLPQRAVRPVQFRPRSAADDAPTDLLA